MKELLGLITVALTVIGHTPYIIDTYKGKTKPHILTWLIWSFVVSLAFLGQWSEGGGAGAWSTGVTGLLVIVITVLALKNNHTEISGSDKFLFTLALFAIVPWYLTDNPTISVIMATAIDACAFIPTVRKTLLYPQSETFATYALNVLRHGLSLLALGQYSIATVLYPLYLLAMNCLVAVIIYMSKRRTV